MDDSPTKHLLGSKKKVKIHPNTVTVKYATHFPQPGDEGYDDAPSFEDFSSFVEESSDKKKLTSTGPQRCGHFYCITYIITLLCAPTMWFLCCIMRFNVREKFYHLKHLTSDQQTKHKA